VCWYLAGLPRIIMAKALNSERLTPARLMSEQELRVWRTTDPKATAKVRPSP
jgi:hypothetical protein